MSHWKTIRELDSVLREIFPELPQHMRSMDLRVAVNEVPTIKVEFFPEIGEATQEKTFRIEEVE